MEGGRKREGERKEREMEGGREEGERREGGREEERERERERGGRDGRRVGDIVMCEANSRVPQLQKCISHFRLIGLK